MTAPWALDRTLRSRFECKYLVSEGLAQEVRRYASPYLEVDYFASQHQSRCYPVHSLYLDGPTHELYQTTLKGLKNRFKLRIRGYDARPESPLFAEVKRRSDRVIRKRRALISRPMARAMLRGVAMPEGSPDGGLDFAEFRSLSARIAARPAVYVSYLREAYEAAGPEPVRLTLDRGLRNAPAGGAAPFDFDRQAWAPTPCDQVILELKYTDACPRWVEGLVQTFQLDRCSVAKYVLCLERSFERFPFAAAFHG